VFRHRYIRHLIDDDQLISCPPPRNPIEFTVVLGFRQFVHHLGGGGETHPFPLPASLHRQSRRQMGFAGSGFPKKNDRLTALHVATFGQVPHHSGRDVRSIPERELFQRLHFRKVRILDASRHCIAFSLFHFHPQQHFQIAEMTLLRFDGLFCHPCELPCNRGQLQSLGILSDRGLLHGNRGRAHCITPLAG
jgi:hypothetical protein